MSFCQPNQFDVLTVVNSVTSHVIVKNPKLTKAPNDHATNAPASNRVSQEQRMSSPSRDSTTVTAPPSPSTTTRTLPLPRQAPSPAGPPQGAPPRAPPTCPPQNARLTPSRPKPDTSSRSTQQRTSPSVSLPHPSSSTRPKVPLEAKHSASALTTDPPPTDHSHTPSRSPPSISSAGPSPIWNTPPAPVRTYSDAVAKRKQLSPPPVVNTPSLTPLKTPSPLRKIPRTNQSPIPMDTPTLSQALDSQTPDVHSTPASSAGDPATDTDSMTLKLTMTFRSRTPSP